MNQMSSFPKILIVSSAQQQETHGPKNCKYDSFPLRHSHPNDLDVHFSCGSHVMSFAGRCAAHDWSLYHTEDTQGNAACAGLPCKPPPPPPPPSHSISCDKMRSGLDSESVVMIACACADGLAYAIEDVNGHLTLMSVLLRLQNYQKRAGPLSGTERASCPRANA